MIVAVEVVETCRRSIMSSLELVDASTVPDDDKVEVGALADKRLILSMRRHSHAQTVHPS